MKLLAVGSDLDGVSELVIPYGVDTLYIADDKRLYPYQTLPTHINCGKLV
ncbi:hypothetical protein [uncultured Draconibacterium sp.]